MSAEPPVLRWPHPPDDEVLVDGDDDAGNRAAQDEHRPGEGGGGCGEALAPLRHPHLAQRRRGRLHQHLGMIREHLDQFRGAGIRNRRGGSEQCRHEKHVGPGQERLRDLGHADPDRPCDERAGLGPADRLRARRPYRRMPRADAPPAGGHGDPLRHQPARGERGEPDATEHQRHQNRGAGAPCGQLELAEKHQVLQPLQQRVIRTGRERCGEEQQDPCQRGAQRFPTRRQQRPRRDGHDHDGRHLPPDHAADARHRCGQQRRRLAGEYAPARVRRLTWQEPDHAEIQQVEVPEQLQAHQPQAVLLRANPGQQHGGEPQAHERGEHEVRLTQPDTAENACGSGHRVATLNSCRRPLMREGVYAP